MGLFGAYLSYRHGKKKGQRQAQLASEIEAERDARRLRGTDPLCPTCGYHFSQHSHDSAKRCPTYS